MKSLKDYILNNISQISIFSRYFGIPEDDINDSINFKVKISNPLRSDPTPSLMFKSYGDKIVSRDYGNSNYSGDIFEVVGFIIDKDCRDSKEFIDICKNIIDYNVSKKTKIDKTSRIEEPTIITIDERSVNNNDFRYFAQYCLPKEYIVDKYLFIKSYCINDIQSTYFYKPSDPCYAYINNPDSIKLYFPLRNKKQKRFITNNRIPIENIDKLTKKDFTVLIKAYKDKIMMEYVCYLLNIDNINFIPVASETARLDKDIVNLIKRYTIKTVFTMFDIDKCGLEAAIYYRDNYGFRNIFIDPNNIDKDPSDLMNNIKIKKFLKLFKTIYENVFN